MTLFGITGEFEWIIDSLFVGNHTGIIRLFNTILFQVSLYDHDTSNCRDKTYCFINYACGFHSSFLASSDSTKASANQTKVT